MINYLQKRHLLLYTEFLIFFQSVAKKKQTDQKIIEKYNKSHIFDQDRE